jgi:hypothetical protein
MNVFRGRRILAKRANGSGAEGMLVKSDPTSVEFTRKTEDSIPLLNGEHCGKRGNDKLPRTEFAWSELRKEKM